MKTRSTRPRPDAPAHGEIDAEAAAAATLFELASTFFADGLPDLTQLTWTDTPPMGPRSAESTEARLRTSEQRLRALVEQIPAVVFMAVLGEGKNEIYVSPHIESMLGFTQKEWLEDPFLWYWRLHPDDRQMWNDEFARGIRHGGPFRAECRFVARGGRIVWVHGEARVIRDDIGRPMLLQGVAFDITDEKRAQEVLLTQAVTTARHDEELAIAQRVQTSILPRKLAVPGLEIAAKMIPADEVGGDYYDVIPAQSGCWIVIGDVAGHGLEAGLVMLMLQSSLSTTILARPDESPSDILRIVNTALVNNVRGRMGSRDHVTLTLFRYTPDGQLVFSGAHEEILVLRRKTGLTETVETPGTWLGARKEVGRFLTDSRLVVEDGDIVVLYTDGITEAKDEAGHMFGLEGLIGAVEAVKSKPCVLIRDNVLAALRRFMATQNDDITLMVLRYRVPERG